MRDIRSDLQERVGLIEDQISTSYAQFEKMIEQLQSEREARVSELKAELSALGKLMEVEHRRMANVCYRSRPLRRQRSRLPISSCSGSAKWARCRRMIWSI